MAETDDARPDETPGDPGSDQTGGADGRVATRARDLVARGERALAALPTTGQFEGERDTRRRRVLERLRVELYALSSIVADATVARAQRDRHLDPPYGLVRSGHTDYKMILASPETVAEGAVDDFHALGKAYVDTTIVHLDREFRDMQADDRAWVPRRLETLLALFRVGATPQFQARMRDAFSFVYGGLHFGTGICVQLAEVSSRLLGAYPDLTVEDRVGVMTRSLRPAYRLAALNVDHVVPAYESLLQPLAGLPTRPGGSVRWLDPAHFAVQEEQGRPVRVELTADLTVDRPTVWTTLGCPARVSPTGGATPIAALWSWCVELCRDTGVLQGES